MQIPVAASAAGHGLRLGRLLTWLLLFLAACGPSAQVCDTSQNCPADAACIDGTCQKRVCAVSADCPIEQFCDQVTGQCHNGCLQDSDCEYGLSCSSGQCVEKPCQSTELDCDVGEFCDTSTGTCFKAAGPYCQPCTDTKYSSDCGGGNNLCRTVAGDGPYCFVECSADLPCPAGYDCAAVTSYGNIVSYNCVTLCQYIESTSDISAGSARLPASQGGVETASRRSLRRR